MTISVSVISAKTPGNIGTIARAMKNFGFTDLLLVDPPSLDPDGDAYGFAGQARDDILPSHTVVTREELFSQYHTVGFTAYTSQSGSRPVRFPFKEPPELAESLASIDVPVALVFGPERTGLSNSELARIDEICSIPATTDYPVLNLGQSATIALYELRSLVLADDETQHPDISRDLANPREVEAFFDHFESFLDEIDYPVEKRGKTMRLVRRLVGRSYPTGREIATFRGILRRASRVRRDK